MVEVNPVMLKKAFSDLPNCGDSFACWESDGKITLCIVDGLGHGENAEVAAIAALQYVGSHISEPLADIFSGCNNEIFRTRGVVMGLAVIDRQNATLTYGGIGNIVARIVTNYPDSPGESMQFIGDTGIVGGGYRRFCEQTVEISPGQLLLMHTDGIPEHLDISPYPAEIKSDLSKLATAIIDDWGKETDDRAVVIYRYDGP
ncbi:MAG: SpoIIE family protein phosphatase [Chloroflexi bacterium]|nr:SpoIIE family protein phosphatase [Chloroflexota bacterium]